VDRHCVKMILEYAQLLSTAHRILDGIHTVGKSQTGRKKITYTLPDSRDTVLYSATHVNHPSAVWTRKNSFTYAWLAMLLYHLCKEYTHRYGKIHKVEASGLLEELTRTPLNLDNGAFCEPTPAMPDDCKVANNSLASYHKYYIKYKNTMAKWTKRNAPLWYVQGEASADV